jgi:NADH-quinone oxidoreductase subunit N
MNSLYSLPATDYIRVLPELILTGFGVFIMMAEAFLRSEQSRKPLGVLAFMGTLVATMASFYQSTAGVYGTGFFGLVRVDAFSVFFHIVICIIAGIAILGSLDWLEAQTERGAEFYAVILMATVGMVLMSSAMELVLIFVALEISSIASYILAGYRRRSASSAEAAIKYFLLGSFATAFFLYGVAMIYGLTGSTTIGRISETLQIAALNGTPPPALLFVAVALMFVGLGFKVGAAPFHVWTPDVYEGAPAPVVALMATAPKAAAFAVLLRVLFGSASTLGEHSAYGATLPGWMPMVWIAAALSMTIGNVGALVQNNIKRLLAYSSIAHAGYLLVAFVGAYGLHSTDGISAAIFYTATYAAMNVGAFIVIAHIAGPEDRWVSLEDYAGLAKRSPLLAMTLTVFLLSLIGIPLTGGFFAKFYVFTAALQNHAVGLTVIGLINSAIAAYYYLRVIVVMYMREPAVGEEGPTPMVPSGIGVALVMSAVFTIFLGVWPRGVLQFITSGAQDLLR